MLTCLRLLRLRAGKSLREMAHELGLPETGLSRVEKARAYVPPAWRERLAKALGVRVEDICDPATGWPLLVDQPQPKLVRRQA